MGKMKFKVGDAVYLRNGFTEGEVSIPRGACMKVVEIRVDAGDYGCIPFSTPSFKKVEPIFVQQSALSNK